MGTTRGDNRPDATARHDRVSPSKLLRTPPAGGPAIVAAACLALLGVGAVPSPAHGSEGEASVWAAVEGANASDTTAEGPQFGLGAQTGVSFGISDFWTLNFGAEGAFHPAVSPGDDEIPALIVQDLFAGFRYNIDIFTYVPYVKLSAVTYTQAPRLDPVDNQRAGVGAKLTVGVDWRFERHWSLGGMAELHAVQLDFEEFPSYSTVGFRLTHHFRL